MDTAAPPGPDPRPPGAAPGGIVCGFEQVPAKPAQLRDQGNQRLAQRISQANGNLGWSVTRPSPQPLPDRLGRPRRRSDGFGASSSAERDGSTSGIGCRTDRAARTGSARLSVEWWSHCCPSPGEVSGSPSRFNATVPEPTSRRTVVPAWTRTARLYPEGLVRDDHLDRWQRRRRQCDGLYRARQI